MNKHHRYHRTTKGRFNSGKSTAKKRGIEWHLTLDEHEKLLSKNKCYYCSSELNETGSGLDRKDNGKPYSKTNCVPCCQSCNSLKSNILSHKEASIIIKVLSLLRSK